MGKTIKITTACLLIGLALSVFFLFKHEKREQTLPLYSKVIKLGEGYGYQIFLNDKLLVQQEFIPAVKGKTPFQSEKDAEKVAKRVIAKIHGKTSPEISLQELNQMDIVLLGQ